MWSTCWVLAPAMCIKFAHNMESYFTFLSIVHKDFCVPDPLLITCIKITLKHSRQKTACRFFWLVSLFFYGFLNETIMVLGMRQCCLVFFVWVENLEQDHSVLRRVLWKALIFMSFVKLNPNVITILAVLVPGKSKQANKQQNKHSANGV